MFALGRRLQRFFTRGSSAVAEGSVSMRGMESNDRWVPPAADDGEAALVPLYVAGVYREAPARLRAPLLECLLRPVGALGLVAVAGGAFAAVRHRHGWDSLQVTLEDTARISAEQVLELSAYLQQTTPEVFRQVGELVAQQPALASSGLSAALLLSVLRRGRR
ncbi:hypothetical protein [Ideonella sp.]|uniref:hypothetical protein n=1 Tax=Ideonella sp. TaxID=1929293 RepID=UPI0035B2758B